MKQLYIKDLKANEPIDEEFLIVEWKEGTTKDGKTYITATLQDNTGNIPAKVWSEFIPHCHPCGVKDFVRVLGATVDFRGKIEIHVRGMEKLEEYSVNNFIRSSKHDIDSLIIKIREYIAKIDNEPLRKFLDATFQDDMFITKFKMHPAAKTYHHAYVGGLAEHVLEMLQVSDSFCIVCPNLNRSILYGGIMMHDIGKLVELEMDDSYFVQYSDSGTLFGHIYLGASWFEKHIPNNFPEDVKDQIVHIILSHHGKLEFGSPVTPKTLEAQVVHHIDNLLASLNPLNAQYDDIQHMQGELKNIVILNTFEKK